MKDIVVTTYRGFSTVSGETTLKQVMKEIKEGTYLLKIEKINKLMEEGKEEEASHVKSQLPYLTLTANYQEKRLDYSLIRYNQAITIDIDGLSDEQIEPIGKLIANDPYTLGCFLSPRRHGYKLFAYLQNAYANQLRQTTFAPEEITYEDLQRYHASMYEACREYYESLLKVSVDTSGKDIGRGFFTSFDTQAYLNEELLEQIEEPRIRIIAPQKGDAKETSKVRQRELEWEADTPARKSHKADSPIPNLEEEMEYNQALIATRKTITYAKGKRNLFLYTLGHKCYTKGIREKATLKLALRDFQSDKEEVKTAIHNAYLYTDKTDKAKAYKDEKVPLAKQVIEFLDKHYDIRRNNVIDRLEFKDFAETEDKWIGRYRPLRERDYNSIYLSLQLSGISCYNNFVKSIVNSNYARRFNPFDEYIQSLRPWDGKVDYIGQLADTVKASDQKFWRESFRKWLVGMVAGVTQDQAVNQLVLILYSEQGKGKSSWIRKLLPPELKEYYCNKMVDPNNKDDLLLLSTHMLINMEEFEGAKHGDIAGLKRIITQETITERKVYDTQAFTFVRRASFIAGTNNRQCLQDISGNRRFLPSVLEEIDYHAEVNYEGVYSQAKALLDSGFRYWYEGKEIQTLNSRNEQHRMREPVEETLYLHFRAATPEEMDIVWKPASAILATLSIYGRMQVNRSAQNTLIQVLERDRIMKRVNEHGTTEYGVVELHS